MKVPGEEVCTVEEYLPGENVYEEEGVVYAKVPGEVKEDKLARTVSITPPMRVPRFNVVGSIVYGRVTQIFDQFVILELFPYRTRRFRLIPPFKYAAIHISQIRKGFVENIRDEFGIGDLVRARVLRIIKKYYLQLSTVGAKYGIIKAFCPKDRTPLRRKGNVLYCPICKREFKRKIAEDYGDPRLPG